ncbi:hypothetical protein KAI52_04375 [Candidatus Parcubacteria bacterium]|nr:hypothetical protein [Candidatus Parcubacteria bacterium]
MPLSNFLQSALWSYNLKKLDIKRDKKIIIEQILNYGTWEQLKWIMSSYSLNEIKRVVENPSRGCWKEDSLNYWLLFFNIKMPKRKSEKALFNLCPKFI